jgi:3-deoxy-D-manno-octulosonic-acid transferase
MIFVYNILLCVSFILLSPFILIAVIFNGKWRESLPERFGIINKDYLKDAAGRQVIWFHAASAGEVQALAPVIKEFKLMKPDCEIVVTSTSVNGKKKIQKELEGVICCAFLLPLDIGFFISPLVERIKPSALIIVETELWPNLLYYASENGVPAIMINGRISVKSFRFYYYFRFFFKKVLNLFHTLIVQSEKMVKRLVRLGVARNKLIILNNTKYSFEVNKEGAKKFNIADKKSKKIIVAGSIREGEEELVIDGFMKAANKDTVLIIAPRHMNRVKEIERILNDRKLKHTLWGDIRDYSVIPDYDCIIVNTIGDLSYIYMIGDIAIIGGGFKDYGGHNPMEAAVAGLSIIMGKNMFNFEDTAERFLKDGGAYQAETAEDIAAHINTLASNDGLRRYNGEKNRNVIERYRGSASTTAMLINEILIDFVKNSGKTG